MHLPHLHRAVPRPSLRTLFFVSPLHRAAPLLPPGGKGGRRQGRRGGQGRKIHPTPPDPVQRRRRRDLLHLTAPPCGAPSITPHALQQHRPYIAFHLLPPPLQRKHAQQKPEQKPKLTQPPTTPTHRRPKIALHLQLLAMRTRAGAVCVIVVVSVSISVLVSGSRDGGIAASSRKGVVGGGIVAFLFFDRQEGGGGGGGERAHPAVLVSLTFFKARRVVSVGVVQAIRGGPSRQAYDMTRKPAGARGKPNARRESRPSKQTSERKQPRATPEIKKTAATQSHQTG
ncbi:hypothetical protein R3P38DRAFT_476557 [Favolaschia claudopus]|uniref:Uncharacterized protein n=1 Tax=Favolaschia claudopus TaxID=2862362 RepID=A0AAW0CK80_9AGAR